MEIPERGRPEIQRGGKNDDLFCKWEKTGFFDSLRAREKRNRQGNGSHPQADRHGQQLRLALRPGRPQPEHYGR